MALTINQLETNSVISLNLSGAWPNSVVFPEQRALAETIKPGCLYLNSVYNATTKQVLCQSFVSGDFVIRVFADNRIELFQENAAVNGVTYDYVYYENDEPITYYMPTGDDVSFSEYDFATNTQQWVKYSQHYDTIPADKKVLLSDFAYNDRIFAWSDQQVGFIVEYIAPLD
jgi:hypothetical protein